MGFALVVAGCVFDSWGLPASSPQNDIKQADGKVDLPPDGSGLMDKGHNPEHQALKDIMLPPDHPASCTKKTKSCYTGPPGTLGVGICKAGTQTCSNGLWGPCLGEVKPAKEVCDGLDNDCNGSFDEVGGWRKRASMTETRGYSCGVYHGGKVYVFGGISRTTKQKFATPVGSAEVYDISANTWSPIAAMPDPRSATGCGVLSGKVVVAGGRHKNNTNTVQIYDIASNKWGPGTPLPSLRSWPATAVSGAYFYVIGGVGNGYLDSIVRYDLTSKTWTSAGSLAAGRYQLGASPYSGGIVAMGGDSWSSGTSGHLVYDHIETYSPSKNSWSLVGSLPTPMAAVDVVSYGGKLYLIYNGTKTYRVDQASWKLTSRPPVPSGHSGGPIVVSTPKGVLIAGGGAWGPNTSTVHMSCSHP